MTKFLQVAPADHNYCIFVYIPMFYQFIVIAMLLILDYIMTMFVIFLFHIIVLFFVFIYHVQSQLTIGFIHVGEVSVGMVGGYVIRGISQCIINNSEL